MSPHTAFAGRIAQRHRWALRRVPIVAATLRRLPAWRGTTVLRRSTAFHTGATWQIQPRLTVAPVQIIRRSTPSVAVTQRPSPRRVLEQRRFEHRTVIASRATRAHRPATAVASAGRPPSAPWHRAVPPTSLRTTIRTTAAAPAPVRPVPIQLRRFLGPSPAAESPTAAPSGWGLPEPRQPQGISSAAAPAPGWSATRPGDVGQLTDLVVRAIDDRLIAHRERVGRGLGG